MKLHENLTTELKRVFVDEVKKTVIAFANTAGGKIYLGVEDDGTAIGINDLDETKTYFFKDGAARKTEFTLKLTIVRDWQPTLLGTLIGMGVGALNRIL